MSPNVIKTDTLTYTQGERVWKEGVFELSDDSRLNWYDSADRKRLVDSILLRDVATFLTVGQYTRNVPGRATLNSVQDDSLLIAMPKNTAKQENQILWIKCKNMNELNSWMSAFVSTLPALSPPPYSSIQNSNGAPAQPAQAAPNNSKNDKSSKSSKKNSSGKPPYPVQPNAAEILSRAQQQPLPGFMYPNGRVVDPGYATPGFNPRYYVGPENSMGYGMGMMMMMMGPWGYGGYGYGYGCGSGWGVDPVFNGPFIDGPIGGSFLGGGGGFGDGFF